MSELNKEALRKFMDAREFCVISTVGSDARPESAFVAYASSSTHEVIIGTSSQSRKAKNITANKSVAVVIADTSGEVQLEGGAEIISSAEYEPLMKAGRFKELAGYENYRNDPTQVYLKISPTWIRFIVHGETTLLTEFTEFA